jgi:hypothetical protein
MMQGCRRGGRNRIKKRRYDLDHPRPVMNPALTPWVIERRERRNRRRDARGRKGAPMDRRSQQLGNAQERADAEVALAAAMGNVTIQKLHDAFAQFWYPDYYPDFLYVAPSATTRTDYSFPGFFTLTKLMLVGAGGPIASRVDVTIDKFTHLPFSLTADRPEFPPLRFRIQMGTDVTVANADAVNGAMLYFEWEMVNMARPTVE